MDNINALIDRLVGERKLIVRRPSQLSWGDKETCEALFSALFRKLDGSIAKYQHLPEYDEVVDWMHDTGGLGLLLIGDCGRGKSIITTGLVPVLLGMKNLYTYPVHADDFNKPYPFAASTMGFDPKMTNLDYLTRCPYPVIDELGVETLINDYGERYEGFNRIINAAERYFRPMFVSTNLSKSDMLNRYGERTLDRLQHLCRIVEFRGESLR
nr:MAG TPA: replicative helicase [Caudoviricetes sp.]